jgi:ABC-type transport system involved in multi-copper enzyme maturation permease subunit
MDAGGLKRVSAVASNTFRESVRERVLYNLVLFAIVMTAAGLVLKPLSLRQDEKIVKDIALAAIDFVGTLIAVFIGVGLVSKEIERRSLYPLLAKPLSRGEFFIGKFLGLAFTLLVNSAVMALGLVVTLLATGKRVDSALFKGIAAIYLGLLLTVSLALFFSAVASSAALATICTVCVVVAGRYADVLRNMMEVLPSAPVKVLQLVYFVIPNFQNFDLKNRVVYGDPLPWAVLGDIALYAALYVSVLLIAGLLAFRRRDLV